MNQLQKIEAVLKTCIPADVTACEEALAIVREMMQQKPCGYLHAVEGTFYPLPLLNREKFHHEHRFDDPVYAAPHPTEKQRIPENCGSGHCSCIECIKNQPRAWVGLTQEELQQAMPYVANDFDYQDYCDFANAISEALKEKNT